MEYNSNLNTPIGLLSIRSDGEGITAIAFDAAEKWENPDEHTKAAVNQLKEYFEGKRFIFDLKLNPKGTGFERKVWDYLLTIPAGATTSYGHIAAQLGGKNLARAVGHANGKNPISIVIPCHRVIGSNNDLIGYAGGLERKKWLLKHEGAVLL